MDIYQEIILDHYQNPRNYGRISDGQSLQLNNPSCGDRISMSLRVENGVIRQASFEGAGCAISQASASMLTEKITGLSVKDVQKMTKDDILRMLGIQLGPARLKCALLSLETAQKVLASLDREE